MKVQRINDVDLYSFNTSYYHKDMNKLSRLLSSYEWVVAQRFHNKNDCECFIINRALVRQIISCYLDQKIDAAKVQFIYNKFKKPFVDHSQNPDNIYFNVSYSNEYCVVAVSVGVEIGVDIEYKRDNLDIFSIAESFFSEKEIVLLRNVVINQQVDTFYNIWTQKEALIKASGKGVFLGLLEWSTDINIAKNIVSVDVSDYLLMSLNIKTGYSGGLALVQT